MMLGAGGVLERAAVIAALSVIRLQAVHSVELRFQGDLVRRLVGVTVKVGLGEVSLAEFDELLAGEGAPRLDVAAWTAPSAGLFLESVRY